jgi:putative ABC transport system substrate-binding protein
MKRREFVTLIGGAAVGWPFAASAQQADRVRHIGVLMGVAADDPDAQARYAAFVKGLQQLGWTDGSNVRIDTRWGAGDADDIRRHAVELAALAPDVILATGNAAVARLLQVPAPCRSCSRSYQIQSAPASSIVCRGRAAMQPALCSSNTV